MKFNKGDEASFFKILLSDSVDYLSLPSAFGKKYLGKAKSKKQTLFIKTKSSVKWRVKYVKVEDKYYFMDGWLKFMKDNRLQIGDFLVFWLRSPFPNLMFQVVSFAPSGCLKHPIISSGAGDGTEPLVKEENSDDEDNGDELLGNVQKVLRRVLRISYIHRVPLNGGFCNATGIYGYDNVQLRNDEGKIWNVELARYRGQKGGPLLTIGWSDFRKGNKIKLQDTFEISHVKGNLLHVKVFKKQKTGIFNKKRSN